ncbi:16399_t:CDS:2 [Funneliformis geosporum]|uniref:4616_t:CDS:1 n=1 Tax=Funneliformis geosporum TaxID=1117311 RepID=A0A9W4SRX3_9GLOM|nr:16399_t:CDS:2 [Funneliformis geosporum]CAI2178310.1 4616_t:CDS:2 [Funneliformis geosporum]
MGFYWIRSEIVSSLTKGRGMPKTRERTNNRGGVDAGDIIVCNWVSYVEIFYLTFRFDPIFTQYYPATNTLRPISLWKAIWNTGSYPNLDPPETETFTLQELVSYAKSKRSRPIVIFPEGTTSNGRALLKFNPIFKDVSIPVNDFKIHIFTVRYDFENFSPTYTVGNKFWHFIRLCSQLINTLQVRSLISDESSFSRYFAPTAQKVTTPDDIVDSQVLNYMVQVGRFRKTGLGIVEKKEFLDFYRKASGGYSKKKK